jgi:hypothetical protein
VRQLGQRLSDPRVKDELKLHATRVAELARLRFLAENARTGAEREKLLARIGKLSAREAERVARRPRRRAPCPRRAEPSRDPAESRRAAAIAVATGCRLLPPER